MKSRNHMARLLVAEATRPPFGTAGPPDLEICRARLLDEDGEML
jgi:hypothetical protein